MKLTRRGYAMAKRAAPALGDPSRAKAALLDAVRNGTIPRGELAVPDKAALPPVPGYKPRAAPQRRT